MAHKTSRRAINKDAALQKIKDAAAAKNLKVLFWPPEKLKSFAMGQITLAELEGMDTATLNRMAQVGHTLLSQGKLDAAQKIFMGLSVFNPYNAYFQLALGSIAQQSNRFDLAEKHYSRAISINAGMIAAYVNRGEVRILQSKLKDAIADFGIATSLDPDGTDPVAQRARAMLSAIRQGFEQSVKK